MHCNRLVPEDYYGVPFPPEFNVPFYIVLCTIYRAFCVCHLSLNSRFHFLHSTFNFDLCNIQVFAFDIQLFISNSQVSNSIFKFSGMYNPLHSFFRIQHLAFVKALSFRFRHPTLDIVLASFHIRHSTFRIQL